MILRGDWTHVDILVWPVPDIDVEVHDPPTLLAAMLSPRVALSVTRKGWCDSNIPTEILDAAMAALPLDSLVTLTAHFRERDIRRVLYEQFWLHHAPK